MLVVDDDRRLRDLLSTYLGKHGYRVTVAASADEARGLLESLAFDIIVLDVMMPGENGFAFADELRQDLGGSDPHADGALGGGRPRARARDRRRRLSRQALRAERAAAAHRLGAAARARAAPSKARSDAVRFGPFCFSIERGELRNGAEVVRLTEREREILRLLCANAGASVSREALAGPAAAAQERTVDVQINRLRRKIEGDPANPLYLQTARGSGYRLVADG